jgi:replication initiation and membrane attachment protein DnaB
MSAMALVLLYVTVAAAQYPLLDMIAGKVVQKYQTATCEQLWQEKSEKKQPTQQEKQLIQLLRSDAKMRAEFINKIAPPVVNKMFECGMVP